ncbi:MAG: anthranilate phosphoribosyltransferase [Verrucomicrobia bacterium]|nr:MAG: anthranilate phosphoribosyltransferase [Verrucomicrobiota bacterium]
MNCEQIIGNGALGEATSRLLRSEDLTETDAAEFLQALLEPDASDAQIAFALSAMAAKGETADELAGMAAAMRARAVPLPTHHTRFIDTAGTGSSAVKTFNVSTAAAFVIAGAGLPVAKHGSRAVTSRAGSADVLEALGVNTGASLEQTQRCLNEHGICFMFAPLFHSATARVSRVRRQLGVRTVFNLLGPLVNPARAPFQLLGVWHRALLERVAAALARVGVAKAWVVHGTDGLDEITLTGETMAIACSTESDGRFAMESFSTSPRDFGLEPRPIDHLRGGGPQENAQLIRAIIDGDKSADVTAARDLVIINAAAALHIAEIAPDLLTATTLAQQSIASGQAAAKLDTLIRETNRRL